jgi:hypothetical protein
VRRVLRWTLILLLPATVLSVWLVPGLVTASTYSLTCCTLADINRPWQPGATVDLHWTVESDNLLHRVFDKNPTHKVFITAQLSGPYSDLAGLKQIILTGGAGAPGGATVHGSDIAMDDRTRPSTTPATTFVLPADLPPGYYDLILSWVDGNGGTGDPTNIVRVGTP